MYMCSYFLCTVHLLGPENLDLNKKCKRIEINMSIINKKHILFQIIELYTLILKILKNEIVFMGPLCYLVYIFSCILY